MPKTDIGRILQSLAWSAAFVGMLWLLHTLFYFTDTNVYHLGIIPRDVNGMLGILTGPLLHSNWSHLISNSGPLFFFGAAIFYFYRPVALRAWAWIYIMTGIWVWISGHDGSHIGASGLVYGLGAFLFFSGVFRKDVRSMTLALLIALTYGGMVWGVLPIEEGVSWESHLFGSIAGVATAFVYRKLNPAPRKVYSWENEPEHDPNDEQAVWNYQKNWPGAKDHYLPNITVEDKES